MEAIVSFYSRLQSRGHIEMRVFDLILAMKSSSTFRTMRVYSGKYGGVSLQAASVFICSRYRKRFMRFTRTCPLYTWIGDTTTSRETYAFVLQTSVQT